MQGGQQVLVTVRSLTCIGHFHGLANFALPTMGQLELVGFSRRVEQLPGVELVVPQWHAVQLGTARVASAEEALADVERVVGQIAEREGLDIQIVRAVAMDIDDDLLEAYTAMLVLSLIPYIYVRQARPRHPFGRRPGWGYDGPFGF